MIKSLSNRVRDSRRKTKAKCVEYLGGKCSICGYNKYNGALQFHHLDPSKKDFGISRGGNTRSFEKIRLELDKCILVCANCHFEIHGGITEDAEVGSSHRLENGST